jgi:myo-inositol-1(or 4)-monophosphatase
MNKTIVYDFVEKAKVALTESSKILWKYFDIHKKDLDIKNKSDGTILTKADIEAEQTITKYLEYFINRWSYLGEEVGLIGKKDSSYQIIADSLDGTSNYYRGRLNFGSSIALIDKDKKNDQVICVVTFEPATKRMWSTIRNEGAYLEQIDTGKSKKIKVSNLDFKKGVLCYDASTKFKGIVRSPQHKMEILDKIVPFFKEIRMIGSNVLAHALVANGSFETAVSDAVGGPYDIAGYLHVQEAGGVSTNIYGEPINILTDRIVVTSNGKMHDELIQVLQCIYST